MEKLFKNPVWEREHQAGAGIQKVYRFDNDFGASVVRFAMPSFNPIATIAKVTQDERGNMNYGSYTNNEKEWELAVIHFPIKSNKKFNLTYKTTITDDVEGHLLEKDVEKILQKIKRLHKKNE